MSELVPNNVAKRANEKRDCDRQRIRRGWRRRYTALHGFRCQGKERGFQISLKNIKANPTSGQTKQEKTEPCVSKVAFGHAWDEVKKVRRHAAYDQGGEYAVTAKRQHSRGM
jgi:hypothetical protein